MDTTIHIGGRYNAAPSRRTKLGRLTGPITRYLNIELWGRGEGLIVPTILATIVGTSLTVSESGGTRQGKAADKIERIHIDRRGQQSRPSEHVGNEGALRVSGARHEVDRWPAGLEANFA